MTLYGSDIRAAGGDLDPSFALVAEGACVGQALAHRLQTPEGGLFYDPEYESVDLRAYLSAGFDGAEVYQLRAKVERALRADERVDDLDLDLRFDPTTETLTVVADGYGAEGPFRLVAVASAELVAVMEAR